MATWSRGTSSSRLGRVYVPPSLASRLVRCAVLFFPAAAGYVSDHQLVSTVFDTSGFLHPRGDTWRLDTSLLTDELALSSFRHSIQTSPPTEPMSPARWEVVKSVCRFHATISAKLFRRRVTQTLNETIRRIRVVQRGGGAHTHLMSEYLTVLRDRYQRLLRTSSRSTATQ